MANRDFVDISCRAPDGAVIDGSLFGHNAHLAVVLAHGAAFNKQSWYPLARRLSTAGFEALTIDFRGYGRSKGGRSGALYQDILGAIDCLEQRGFRHIALVGASMGGSAVLNALAQTTDARISAAILLAPAGGPPLAQPGIRKLFVVSEEDGLRPEVERIFAASADPKTLRLFSGNAHAQNLFYTDHAAALDHLIVTFLGDNSWKARPN